MLSDIQTNTVMLQNNNLAFRGKGKFLQRVRQNFLFSPEQKKCIRWIMQSDFLTKEEKKVVLTNLYSPENYTPQPIKSYFANFINNLKRIFIK